MDPIRASITRLAFQADRKLLQLEEEEYYRLDISAHEKLNLAAFGFNKAKARTLEWSGTGRFILTAGLIFTLLFAATNAAAYSKILMANIADAKEAKLAAIPVQQLEKLQSDPWAAQKGYEHVYVEQELEALEEAEIIPENGILPLNLAVSTYDNRIRIPAINVNAPIQAPELGIEALKSNDWNVLEDQIRQSLLQGAVHYPGTANPGQKGNVFITGHSSNVFWEPSPYNTLFALLPRLQEGDDIYITHNQKEFHYRITTKKEVSPKDVSVLSQGGGYTMTLMTCTPVGTNLKRLVVTAELVS